MINGPPGAAIAAMARMRSADSRFPVGLDGEWMKITIDLQGRTVYAKIWELKVGRISLFLLDTDVDENSWEERSLTHQLYGGDSEHRIKQEILLVIVGGVFVIEAASVVIQSGWFKYTRKRYGEGRRVFKCAPLHHHFEFVEKERAMDEQRPPELVETVIVTRFWILGIIFALIGIATLKIR